MRLVIFSHKPCWQTADSPSGYVTDGGFPFHMRAISELFDSTTLMVPCEPLHSADGIMPLMGHNLSVVPLTSPGGKKAIRKALFPVWVLRNLRNILREISRADAVHAPIPGDIGTIGMLLAVVCRKPLFVRHCGNWFVQKTIAERFWKWFMERFAGGHNVMLATGGGESPPSRNNPDIDWIFSTSMTGEEIKLCRVNRRQHDSTAPRLIIVCRQERSKGVGLVIDSLPRLIRAFPEVNLDVVGDGDDLPLFQQQAQRLGVEDRIRFHGKLDHGGVIARLRQADLFCYPTAASEGFPKVVLEALACGLPVITTAVSVLPSLIGMDCGRILEEVTAAALAREITSLWSTPEIYRRLSEQAHARATLYSLENWQSTIGQILAQHWGVLRADDVT